MACLGLEYGRFGNGIWQVWERNLASLGLELLLTWVVRNELDNWRSLLGVSETWCGV